MSFMHKENISYDLFGDMTPHHSYDRFVCFLGPTPDETLNGTIYTLSQIVLVSSTMALLNAARVSLADWTGHY